MGKTLYIIAGPTAVGKTAIAIALAKRLRTEIISADSRQCYQGMAIGTAQPTAEELREVKHYFINEFPVTRSLTAADYEQLALGHLDEIFKTHDTAVVCGGTGLYIKALTEGMDEMPAIDKIVAAEVNNTYEQKGVEWLQQTIATEDPEFYASGEVQNPARLLRALIFKRSAGESILNYRSGKTKVRPFKIIKVGIELPREVLYQRINHRVDVMVEQGLLEEVKALLPQKDLKNLQTVGYTEVFDYLDGSYTLNEAIDKIKQHTRNYAKRQMTWFRKDKEMHWLQANDKDIIDKILKLV